MVYHLPGHAAINADVFACDESCPVETEVEHHIVDVHWMAYATCGLLQGIRTFVFLILRVNPSWRDGVDPCLTPKRNGKGVGEG